MANTLYLLKMPFKDAAVSDEDFYCWTCLLLDGLTQKFSEKLSELDIQRIEFLRPRQKVVDIVGPDNQSLPMLVLDDNVLIGRETGTFGKTRFIKGKDEILDALTDIYAIPRQHP